MNNSKENAASTMDSLDAAFQDTTLSGRVGLEALNLANQSQKILQKSVAVILPLMLMLGGVGTIVYRFATYDEGGSDAVKGFLVMVWVQLLPMTALKFKTWLCADRASLMPTALVKTMMMHVAVQVFRMIYHVYAHISDSFMKVAMWQQAFDAITLVMALYILFREFGVKVGALASKDSFVHSIKEHSDVLTTIAGGCCAAIIVDVVAPLDGKSARLIWILNDLANYMELLAFVPVARIVCLENAVEESTPGTNVVEGDRRKANMVMAFILAFYFWDDIVFTVGTSEIPLVAAAKAAHFVMLIDFAGHFVLQVGAQSKIVNEILPKVLPKAILQEVAPTTPQQDSEMTFQGDERKGLLGEEEDEEESLA